MHKRSAGRAEKRVESRSSVEKEFFITYIEAS
jgi:hypothetical protein